MATSNQARYWSPHYSVAGQWNRPHIQNNYTYEEDTFVTIRRSRKGTRLNIPTTDPFVLRRKPLSYIESIPVLPNGECCDMKYTLHRQLEETWLPRGQVYDPNNPRCTPSVTINIGTAPFGPSGMYSQQNMSMSTLSINPTVISEEPWVTQRTVTPLGLHCCGNRTVCDHAQSKTLQEAKKDPSANPLEDNKFVYLTTAPRISPLKSCWNFLAFKKKRTQGDVYLPAAITKAEQPKKLIDCPNCSNSIINSNDENGQMNSVPSTVAGSEMTISEFSSEEFISPVRRGEKEKKFKQVQKMNTDPPRITANNSQLMAQPSFNVNRTAMLSPPGLQYSPEGPVYWWVCKPIESKKNKKFLQNHPKKYICYRDQQ